MSLAAVSLHVDPCALPASLVARTLEHVLQAISRNGAHPNQLPSGGTPYVESLGDRHRGGRAGRKAQSVERSITGFQAPLVRVGHGDSILPLCMSVFGHSE